MSQLMMLGCEKKTFENCVLLVSTWFTCELYYYCKIFKSLFLAFHIQLLSQRNAPPFTWRTEAPGEICYEPNQLRLLLLAWGALTLSIHRICRETLENPPSRIRCIVEKKTRYSWGVHTTGSSTWGSWRSRWKNSWWTQPPNQLSSAVGTREKTCWRPNIKKNTSTS